MFSPEGRPGEDGHSPGCWERRQSAGLRAWAFLEILSLGGQGKWKRRKEAAARPLPACWSRSVWCRCDLPPVPSSLRTDFSPGPPGSEDSGSSAFDHVDSGWPLVQYLVDDPSSSSSKKTEEQWGQLSRTGHGGQGAAVGAGPGGCKHPWETPQHPDIRCASL